MLEQSRAAPRIESASLLCRHCNAGETTPTPRWGALSRVFDHADVIPNGYRRAWSGQPQSCAPIVLAEENKLGSVLFHQLDSALAQHVHCGTSCNLHLHRGPIVEHKGNQPFFFGYEFNGPPSNDVCQRFIHLHKPEICCSELFESRICAKS